MLSQLLRQNLHPGTDLTGLAQVVLPLHFQLAALFGHHPKLQIGVGHVAPAKTAGCGQAFQEASKQADLVIGLSMRTLAP